MGESPSVQKWPFWPLAYRQIPAWHAKPANKQGRIAADHLCGQDSAYHGAYASSVIKVFDMTAAATGINEHAAKEAGLSYEKIVLSRKTTPPTILADVP